MSENNQEQQGFNRNVIVGDMLKALHPITGGLPHNVYCDVVEKAAAKLLSHCLLSMRGTLTEKRLAHEMERAMQKMASDVYNKVKPHIGTCTVK